jgi:hypothetical protein
VELTCFGTIVIDDRGDIGFCLFAKWKNFRGFFVAHMKNHAQFDMLEQKDRPTPLGSHAQHGNPEGVPRICKGVSTKS